MSHSPVIRPATSADAEVLADVAARTFRDAFAKDNTAEDMDAYTRDAFSTEQLAVEIQTPGNHFLLAFTDAPTPAGYAKVRSGATGPGVTAATPVELHRLYVEQPALGKGVGPALLQASIDTAQALGGTTIWLGVWEHNARAIRFYQKWGFTVVGAQTFTLGRDQQTDLIMQRSTRDEMVIESQPKTR